jgi:hypothetical protein
MSHAQPLILAAILIAAIQAEARHAGAVAAEQVLPLQWLSENLAQGSSCTGIDLNIGCVSIEVAGQTGDSEVAPR